MSKKNLGQIRVQVYEAELLDDDHVFGQSSDTETDSDCYISEDEDEGQEASNGDLIHEESKKNGSHFTRYLCWSYLLLFAASRSSAGAVAFHLRILTFPRGRNTNGAPLP